MIRDVVIHTTVLFRPENSPSMFETTLVNVHHITIPIIKYKMSPRHFVHLPGKRKIFVPPQRFCPVKCLHVIATSTRTKINELVVINILVTQFPESVSSRLMLDDTARIQGIAVSTQRAERNSRTISPHLAYSAIIRGIRSYNHERLIQITFIHRGHS